MVEINNIILDMDGVLYTGELPIGNLAKIFDEIRKRKYKLMLATNNSTLSPDSYVAKLKKFGVSVKPEQIINSAEATMEYIKTHFPERKRIFMVGEIGLSKAIRKYGFQQDDTKADIVVVGLDREVTYRKLAKAFTFLLNDAIFLATNPDVTIPTSNGLAPGTGSILAALEAAIGKKAIIIGKPEPMLFEIALSRINAKPENTIVVGDRLETDIAGGNASRCKTALVLSGVTDRAYAAQSPIRPDYIAKSLEDLLFRVLAENV